MADQENQEQMVISLNAIIAEVTANEKKNLKEEECLHHAINHSNNNDCRKVD